MSLVPTWPFAVGTLVIGLAVGTWGMHTWDESAIAALELKLAKKDTAIAQTNAANSQADLKDFKSVAATINSSAQLGQEQFSALGNKLDTLAKAYKNAKPTVLAPDCKPGTVRVQNLAERAAAVDQAAARPVSGQ